MTGKHKPIRRSERLLERRVGDEVVLYDLDSDEAHLLTPLAAEVWRSCDGDCPVEGMVAGEDRAAVEAAVVELERARLVTVPPRRFERRPLSRRRFLTAAAATAAAAPLVTTILAPTPAAAVTCTGTAPGDQCDCPTLPAVGATCATPAGTPKCCVSGTGLVCCRQGNAAAVKCAKSTGGSCAAGGTGNECCSGVCSAGGTCT